MMDDLVVRMAHLEGAYEQIDRRLGGVESGLVQLREEMHSGMGQLRTEMGQLRSEMGQLRSDMGGIRSETSQFRSEVTGRMDGQFRWLLGTILTTWVTVLLAIFVRS